MSVGTGGGVVAIGRVLLRADNKELTHDLKSAEAQAKRSSNVMGTVLKAGFVAAAAGAGLLVVGLKKSFDAAKDAEVAGAKVETMLKNLGISYKDHRKQIDDTITAQSRLSGLDDEELSESFANMARTTGDVTEALKLNGLAADLARTKGMDLSSAQSLLARVYNGSFNGLKRLGIAIEPVTTAQDALKASTDHATAAQVKAAKEADFNATRQQALGVLYKQFGGQAEAYGKTAAGAQDRMRVAVENLMEKLGGALLPTVTKVITKISEFVERLTESERVATIVKGAVGFLGDVFAVLRDVITAVVEKMVAVVGFFQQHAAATAILKDVVLLLTGALIAYTVATNAISLATKGWAIAQKLLNIAMAANPFILIVTLLVAVGVALVEAYRHSEKFRDIVNGVFDKVKSVAQSFVSFFTEKVPHAFSTVLDWLKGHWPIIATIISGPFAPIVALATNAFGIRDKLKNAFTSIKDWAKEKVDQVVGFFMGIPGKIVNLGGNLARGLGGAFKSGINAIIGALNSFQFSIGWDKIVVPYAPDIPGFHTTIDPIPHIPYLMRGGVVPMTGDAVRGKDSVLILGTPGEVMLNEKQQRPIRTYLESLFGPLPGYAAGGVVGGPSGLDKSLWDEYALSKAISGWRDLGTYNPSSVLPSGSPSDHAVYPAMAFDAGFSPATGWSNMSARAFFNSMKGRAGVNYVILGDKIWSRSQGLHAYINATDHANHVHVSGVRGSPMPGGGGAVGATGANQGGVASTGGTSSGVRATSAAAPAPPAKGSPAAVIGWPSEAEFVVMKGAANKAQAQRSAVEKALIEKYSEFRAQNPGYGQWSIETYRQKKAAIFAAQPTYPSPSSPSGGPAYVPPEESFPDDFGLGEGDGDFGGGDIGGGFDTGGGAGGPSGPTQDEINAQIAAAVAANRNAVLGARSRFIQEYQSNIFTPTLEGLVPGSRQLNRAATVNMYFTRQPDDPYTYLRQAQFAAEAAMG